MLKMDFRISVTAPNVFHSNAIPSLFTGQRLEKCKRSQSTVEHENISSLISKEYIPYSTTLILYSEVFCEPLHCSIKAKTLGKYNLLRRIRM